MAMLSLTMMLVPPAFATNGINLIGIGPIARSMGGVGIAQPMDAISAVFSNPAAMCFGKYCPGSEFNFASTLFMPKIDAKVTHSGSPLASSGIFQADSEDNIYPIPAIGFSVPVGPEGSKWRFGLAAYGVSGLGVDYRNTSLDNSRFYDFTPLPPEMRPADYLPMVAGEYTQLQIMKFAPSFAYQATPNLSIGLALPVDYGVLDLKSGSSSGFALGLLPGIIYKPIENLSLGLTYTAPQKINYKNVLSFGGPNYSLELESPQQVGFGIAYDFFETGLVLEADVKWINWSNADGYQDFDWEDQTVFAVGAQYQATDKLVLRAGYNYAKNPVNEHNNFIGTTTTTVQGITMPTYYYETFRIIGFPAIVEHHVTLGIGYQFTDAFSLDLGFVYAVENTMTETGKDLVGGDVTLESTLSETSLDFGLTWRF